MTLRVLTLNLWHDSGPWPARRERIREWIDRLAPDLIAFQEVLRVPWLDQLPDLLGARTPRTINMSTIGDDLLREAGAAFGPRIEALVVYNSNPVAVAPESPKVVAGFQRPDLFTVVLEQLPESDVAADISQALSDCLRLPIDVAGIAIEVGVSIGSARFPEDGEDPLALLRMADVAMYAAKRRGTTHERYDAAADANSLRRLAIGGELRPAIASNALALHFQPQVNLHSAWWRAARRWCAGSIPSTAPSRRPSSSPSRRQPT